MTNSIESSIIFNLSSEKEKNEFINALKSEERNLKRSSWTVSKNKKGIVFKISAQDPVAFRATLNAISQYMIIFNKTELFEKVRSKPVGLIKKE